MRTPADQKKIRHLMLRAGFGPSLQQWTGDTPAESLAEELLRPGAEPQRLEVISLEEWADYAALRRNKEADPVMMREKQRSYREKLMDLNRLWMQELVVTETPLREKMALFWHNHFATRTNNPYFDQQLLHVIRSHALGNFRTLLLEVSKSPAMLSFLNNQQNRRQHPNENFARELMELFTLGRGHYTEHDIREAARAFTGWAYNKEGVFEFRPRQHDDGEKTVLGRSGRLTGEEVLDILLQQKQTALFLTQKIYRAFVSEQKTDPGRVQELATIFYESDYHIGTLMNAVFRSPWFYRESLAGSRVKSPVELLVGYQRLLPMTFSDPRTLINLQRSLGQLLFFPPNVGGWPGGLNWIDSSSLVIRMRLPEALWGSKELDLSPKEIDAEMGEVNRKPLMQDSSTQRFRVGKATTDWSAWLAYWKAQDRDRLPELMAQYLLPITISPATLQELGRYVDKDTPEEYIRSLSIRLMSLPEYQLC